MFQSGKNTSILMRHTRDYCTTGSFLAFGSLLRKRQACLISDVQLGQRLAFMDIVDMQ